MDESEALGRIEEEVAQGAGDGQAWGRLGWAYGGAGQHTLAAGFAVVQREHLVELELVAEQRLDPTCIRDRVLEVERVLLVVADPDDEGEGLSVRFGRTPKRVRLQICRLERVAWTL